MDWYAQNQWPLFSTPRGARINHLAFVDVDSKGNQKFNSVYDVLDEICKAFGARFFWSNGKYHFIQVNGYNKTGVGNGFLIYKWTNEVGQYTQVAQILETEYETDAGNPDAYNAGNASLYKLSGDILNYYPPLQKVEVNYTHLNTFNLLFNKSWSNTNFPLVHQFETIDSNSSSAKLAFRTSYNYKVTVTDSSVTSVRLRSNIRIKVGDEYLERDYTLNNGAVNYNPVQWTTDNEYYEHLGLNIPIATNIEASSFENIEFITPDIPDDGDLEFTITIDLLDQDGNIINPLDYTIEYIYNNPYLELFYNGNYDDQSVTRRFTSTNSLGSDNTKIITVDTILGEGTNNSVLGNIEVINTSAQWVDADGWRVGSNSGNSYVKFSQLLANEIISGQLEPTVKMTSGTFYGTDYEFENTLIYFSNKYLPLNVTFNLGQDIVSGLFYKHSTTDSFGEEIEVDLPTTGDNGGLDSDGLQSPSSDPNFLGAETIDFESINPVTNLTIDSLGELSANLVDSNVITSISTDIPNLVLGDDDVLDIIHPDTLEVQQVVVKDSSWWIDSAISSGVIPIDSRTVSGNYPVGSYIIKEVEDATKKLRYTRIQKERFKLFSYSDEITLLSDTRTIDAYYNFSAEAIAYKNTKIIGLRTYIGQQPVFVGADTEFTITVNMYRQTGVKTPLLIMTHTHRIADSGTDVNRLSACTSSSLGNGTNASNNEDGTIYFDVSVTSFSNAGSVAAKGLHIELLYTHF